MSVEPTQTVTVDDKVHAVALLPDPIKRKVEIYDKWKQEYEDLQVELLKLSAAMQEIGRSIGADIAAHEAEKSKPQPTEE